MTLVGRAFTFEGNEQLMATDSTHGAGVRTACCACARATRNDLAVTMGGKEGDHT